MENETTVAMRDVASGHIKSVGHHEGNLYVEFTGGIRYRYLDVPKSLYEGFFADGVSPGKYLHAKVKGQFKHEQLERKL